MRRNQFAVSTAATILNLLIQFSLSFFLTSYLVKSVGETAYGFFSMANTIVNYALIVTNALNSLAARFIGIRVHNQDWNGAKRYFSSVFAGDLIFALIILLPSCIAIAKLELLLHIPADMVGEVKILFLIVFLNMCVNVVGSVFGCVYTIKNRMDILSELQIVSNVVKAALLIVLYSIFKPTIVFLGAATLMATLVLLLGNLFFTKRLLPQLRISRRFVKGSAIKEITFSGIWNSFNHLSVTLLNGLDLLVANLLVSTKAMGVLSIANTIPGVIATCISALANLFTPRFLERYAQCDYEGLLRECKGSIRFMTVISVLPISFLIVFGEPFFKLWTPNTDVVMLYRLSILVLLPQIAGASISSMTYLYAVVNKVKWQAVVLFLSGVTNVMLVFTLLHTTNLGIYAVAGVSAVIGFVRYFAFDAPYAARCIKMPYYTFWPNMLVSLLAVTVATAFGCFVNYVFTPDTWIELILVGGLTEILVGVVAVMIILPREQRMALLSKFRRS